MVEMDLRFEICDFRFIKKKSTRPFAGRTKGIITLKVFNHFFLITIFSEYSSVT
jgi:hypothetical protein